jgi:phospholipid/cholesterol/gamma-HCH transport system ATP-binding protein
MSQAVSTPAPPPLARYEEAGVRFGAQEVLRNVNASIQRGQTVVILGESGCGKTVMLKLLIGLLASTTGRVLFDGRVMAGLDERELTRQRLRFGYLFQSAALFDSMSVYDNVAFPLREHTTKAEAQIRDAVRQGLQEVGLTPGVEFKKPAELSGGMRKRVGLARALIMKPEIMLYDEPTTGLDPIMTDVINELIVMTHERHQVTSLVVTHEMKTVHKVADRVVMLYPVSRLRLGEPQVIFDGDLKALEACMDPRVSQFVRGEAGAALRGEY